MAQTIRYMSAAVGVTPAADNQSTTLQPSQGSFPAVTPPQAATVQALDSQITLATATDPLATGDIYVAGCVPAGMKPTRFLLMCQGIDTGSSLTLTLAQLAKNFTDIVAGTDVITASTIGQAGGVAGPGAAVANATAMMLPAFTEDKWYGVKVAAAATGLNTNTLMKVIIDYHTPAAG